MYFQMRISSIINVYVCEKENQNLYLDKDVTNKVRRKWIIIYILVLLALCIQFIFTIVIIVIDNILYLTLIVSFVRV